MAKYGLYINRQYTFTGKKQKTYIEIKRLLESEERK